MTFTQIKKFLLSAFVVVSFGVYAFSNRSEGTQDVLIPASPSTGGNDQASSNTPPVTLNPPPKTTQTSPKTTSTTPKPWPSPTPTPPPPAAVPKGQYKDGEYVGNIADAYYGNVQVKAIVQGGKLVDVQFLDYPNDRQNSIRINTYALPILRTEAVQSQNANVDVVSGATATSGAFVESLGVALAAAKNS